MVTDQTAFDMEDGYAGRVRPHLSLRGSRSPGWADCGTPRSVVLVGNGPSLAGSGLGGLIDRFDVVVRFNGYRVEGHEYDVGTRTDWWVRNELGVADARPTTAARILLRGRTSEGGEVYDRSVVPVWQLVRARYPDATVRLIPFRAVERFRAVVAPDEYPDPLTGSLAIEHLLETCAAVTVCGFDCLVGNRLHYAPDEEGLSAWRDVHRGDLDLRYLRVRSREGRVVFLGSPAGAREP